MWTKTGEDEDRESAPRDGIEGEAIGKSRTPEKKRMSRAKVDIKAMMKLFKGFNCMMMVVICNLSQQAVFFFFFPFLPLRERERMKE